jgi:RNA polymerase sigma-70 factor (ECF subfamily)
MVAPLIAPSQTIDELVDRGDFRLAIDAIATEWAAPLGRLCFALLASHDDAQEVAQESLLAAFRGLDNYRGEGSLKAWLFGIARKQCAKRLTQRTKNNRVLKVVSDNKATDPARPPHGEAADVREALAKLRPSERDALVLRYQGGLSYRELGECCGISEANARKRTSRALVRLREVFIQEKIL